MGASTRGRELLVVVVSGVAAVTRRTHVHCSMTHVAARLRYVTLRYVVYGAVIESVRDAIVDRL